MIQESINRDNSLLVCPECKNNVDLSRYPAITTGMVVECNHCGMTLLIKEVKSGSIVTVIVDEGK